MLEITVLILVAGFFYALGWRLATRRHERVEEIAQELRAGVINGWPPLPRPLPKMPTPPAPPRSEPIDSSWQRNHAYAVPKFTNAVPAYVVVGENSLRGEGK
ncbi:MAG TPA: hypothetical protein VKX25_19650 [Bryobacteraceae bacterium]|nr:hypothetical protein [Bryobacteraceae bacterium]